MRIASPNCSQTLALSGPARLDFGSVGCYILTLDGDPVAFTATTNCAGGTALQSSPACGCATDMNVAQSGVFLVPAVVQPMHVCYIGPAVDTTVCSLAAEHDQTAIVAEMAIEVGSDISTEAVCGACAATGPFMLMTFFSLIVLKRRRTARIGGANR